MIREVMGALAIPVVEAPGFEADDVIATLATEAAARQCEVVIVTGDRDSFQLVHDPYIRVLYNKRGVSDYSLYDEAGIVERSGVPPSQYVLLASLRGDPSDNLPGRARGGGEDRRQAADQLRRPRRGLRPPRRADAEAAGEPGGERGAGPVQRPHHPARARRAARRRRGPPDPGRLGPRPRPRPPSSATR